MLNTRRPDHPVDPLFVERWSPRAFSEKALSRDQLMSLFEAARWAPSCYNEQPWFFLYALRGSPDWEVFMGLLVEFNQSWVKEASALVALVSHTRFARNDKPNRHHSFDCGAAWQNLALQASSKGLATHAMAGFDHARAVTVLGLPPHHQAEAMIAIGRPGHKDQLPEGLREKEVLSGRKPLQEFVFEGGWSQSQP